MITTQQLSGKPGQAPALHDIARTRMRDCPNTRAYVTRRTSETPNFTTRDARRCLKRYLARHL